MKEIGNFIGGVITLFFFGAIVYGIFKEGHTTGIIVVVSLAILLWLLFIREERKAKEEKLRQESIEKAAQEEKLRIQRIENMNESEFISFVKYNHDELDKHFKNGRITKLGHGNSTKQWHTSKYVIESIVEDNDFNEFINIYRKSDNAKILSCGWGLPNF